MDNRYPVARSTDSLNSFKAGEHKKNRITARMWVIHFLSRYPGLDDTHIAKLHDDLWKAERDRGRPFAGVAHTRLRTERGRLVKEGAVEFAGQGVSTSGRSAATWRLPERDRSDGHDRVGGASGSAA